VAALADYAAVRELVYDLIAEAGEVSVPTSIRETVAAVARLAPKESTREVTAVEIAHELQLDKSAASRRVRAALQRGYLSNRETHRGRPARIVLDAPLPKDVVVLPELETLRGHYSAADERTASAPPAATASVQEPSDLAGDGCRVAADSRASLASCPTNTAASPDDDDPPPAEGGRAREATAFAEQAPELTKGRVVTVETPAAIDACIAALQALDPDVPVGATAKPAHLR
jgi:hypothetical protein